MYKLADDFAQFLGMLYIEESEIDEEYDDWNEWSEEEFDQLLSEGTDEEELSVALLSVSQSTTDYQWLGQVFLRLSQHQHSFVRNQVAEIVWNGAAPYLEESTLTILLERFEKDENLDVRQYAESIREDLNRSYEDWVLSLDDSSEYVSSALLYQKKSMLIFYKEEGTWALERDGEIVHTSQTKEELLNNVTVDGQQLKAIWSQLKIA
ncbi:hypothetical protein JCM19045_1602 [Bacillus sp. JCM 19045]|nr:hypothetical protein JCM19045_1602 [Bacillus sp. JCM 19045]